MAVTAPQTLPHPRWPAVPVDPSRVRVNYHVPADELTLYFGDTSATAISAPMDAFDGDVAVIFDELSGEVLGIHGIPFLLGSVIHRPEWAALAWALLAGDYGEEVLRQVLPNFIGQVAATFARYGLDGRPLPGEDGAR